MFKGTSACIKSRILGIMKQTNTFYEQRKRRNLKIFITFEGIEGATGGVL